MKTKSLDYDTSILEQRNGWWWRWYLLNGAVVAYVPETPLETKPAEQRTSHVRTESKPAPEPLPELIPGPDVNGRPWWMERSPTYNKKRWDADVCAGLLASKTPEEAMSQMEREHWREFSATKAKL